MILLWFALACVHAETSAAPSVQVSDTILFVDPDGTQRTEPIASVPETIAYYTDAAGKRVAVARIEASNRGGAIEIKRFGADGALLDVTMSTPPPPRR